MPAHSMPIPFLSFESCRSRSFGPNPSFDQIIGYSHVQLQKNAVAILKTFDAYLIIHINSGNTTNNSTNTNNSERLPINHYLNPIKELIPTNKCTELTLWEVLIIMRRSIPFDNKLYNCNFILTNDC